MHPHTYRRQLPVTWNLIPTVELTINAAILIMAAGAQVLFTADDGQHGCELWASDGSEKGTFRISDYEEGTGKNSGSRVGHCPEQLTVSQGKLYYSDYGRLGDNELWAWLTQGAARR